MLEAMASGLPVFATQHGGIPEAIENGVSGVLVPERDHEKLAAALLDAAQDSGFLSRIALNGAEIVRKNFDLRAQAQRLKRFICGQYGVSIFVILSAAERMTVVNCGFRVFDAAGLNRALRNRDAIMNSFRASVIALIFLLAAGFSAQSQTPAEKPGGPLKAVAVLYPTAGSKVSGTVTFTEEADGVKGPGGNHRPDSWQSWISCP
jgi:hypothetical protein